MWKSISKIIKKKIFRINPHNKTSKMRLTYDWKSKDRQNKFVINN